MLGALLISVPSWSASLASATKTALDLPGCSDTAAGAFACVSHERRCAVVVVIGDADVAGDGADAGFNAK